MRHGVQPLRPFAGAGSDRSHADTRARRPEPPERPGIRPAHRHPSVIPELGRGGDLASSAAASASCALTGKPRCLRRRRSRPCRRGGRTCLRSDATAASAPIVVGSLRPRRVATLASPAPPSMRSQTQCGWRCGTRSDARWTGGTSATAASRERVSAPVAAPGRDMQGDDHPSPAYSTDATAQSVHQASLGRVSARRSFRGVACIAQPAQTYRQAVVLAKINQNVFVGWAGHVVAVVASPDARPRKDERRAAESHAPSAEQPWSNMTSRD